MPEFKIKCWYYGERKNIFFKDKGKQIYHKFNVDNAKDLPDKFFRSLWKNELNERLCWLWISDELIKQENISLEREKDYCFLMKLGEYKTATFNIKDSFAISSEKANNMVLKSKDYWENTVQKIGFWGSNDYFFEKDKKQKTPRTSSNSSAKIKNKNDWGKITLICLAITAIILFSFLIIKLASVTSKRKK